MQRFRLQVKKEAKGQRLDQYVISNLNIPISRSRLQRLINAGEITVNSCDRPSGPAPQKAAKAHYKVKENDSVLINIPQVPRSPVLPEQIPLDIVFEDEDLLIVDKPAGMTTHPAPGNYSHTLVNALLNYACPLSSINGPLRPGIVHRLDKDTSGLLVVAKNDSAHLKLAQQFQKHTVKREYIAIVKGRLKSEEGIIDYPLARHPHNRQKIQVSFLKEARAALTRYKVLQRFNDFTFLQLSPHTGRTHQLRVHLKFCGHPILGDSRYGQAASFIRLALHAKVLGFYHPRAEKYVEFCSDIPECFKSFLKSAK